MWVGDFLDAPQRDSLCLRVSANEFGCVGRLFGCVLAVLLRALSKTKVYAGTHTS